MAEREPAEEPRRESERGNDRGPNPQPMRHSAAEATGEPKQPEHPSSDPMARGYAMAEERNRRAREALEPLQPGERPGAVTLGAWLAGLVAVVFWASLALRLFTDIEVEGRQPDPVQITVFAAVMTAMAVGMWKVRYWAVLGFQILLVLFLVAATLGLLTAETLVQAVATTALIGVTGFVFYRMIKAMARIQMPERRQPPR